MGQRLQGFTPARFGLVVRWAQLVRDFAESDEQAIGRGFASEAECRTAYDGARCAVRREGADMKVHRKGRFLWMEKVA